MSFLAALAVDSKYFLANRVASSQKRCAVPCCSRNAGNHQGANFCLGKNLRLDAINYTLCFRVLQGVFEKFKKPEITRPLIPISPVRPS